MNEESKNLQIKTEDEDFSCPNCGAPIDYNPDSMMLECDYCGFKQKVDGTLSDEEFDFYNGLKENTNLWDKEVKIIKCENCGAENVVPSNTITNCCPFCGSNQVVDTFELAGIKPHRVIPFTISKDKAQLTYITWIKKRFFSPRQIKKEKIKLYLNGVYLPVWTFDTNTFSSYDGTLGKHYTTTVGSGKNRMTITNTRWFHIKGTTQVIFDDILVNGGSHISQSEILSISPFSTNESFLYDQKFLVGFSAEHYKIKLDLAWNNAKSLAAPKIKKKILSKYSYDVVGEIKIKTTYNNIKYKYVLVPVWIGVYQYKNKKYRFLVNGETGKLSGKAPVSVLKIVIFITTIVILGILVMTILYIS